jgi:hypothetical protein
LVYLKICYVDCQKTHVVTPNRKQTIKVEMEETGISRYHGIINLHNKEEWNLYNKERFKQASKY